MTEQLNSPEDGSVDIRRYLGTLKYGARGAAIGLVVGTLMAAAYLIWVPKTYTATATVNINPITTTPFASGRSASGLLDPSTEAALATSAAVSELAVQGKGSAWDPSALRKSISANAVTESTILTVSSVAGTPDLARRQADAVAKAYLAYRGEQAEVRRDSIIAGTDEGLRELQTKLTAATTAGASNVGALREEMQRLNNARTQSERMDTYGGTVINPASAAPVYASPTARPILAAGLLGAPALGMVLALGLAAVRRRVRGSDELAGVHGLDLVVELTNSRRTSPPAPTTSTRCGCCASVSSPSTGMSRRPTS